MRNYIPTYYKPCPRCKAVDVFCCSKIELDANQKLTDYRYFVLCNECGFEGAEKADDKAAINAWNHPPVIEPVRRYKEI